MMKNWYTYVFSEYLPKIAAVDTQTAYLPKPYHMVAQLQSAMSLHFSFGQTLTLCQNVEYKFFLRAYHTELTSCVQLRTIVESYT